MLFLQKKIHKPSTLKKKKKRVDNKKRSVNIYIYFFVREECEDQFPIKNYTKQKSCSDTLGNIMHKQYYLIYHYNFCKLLIHLDERN